eukprot:TRINITY_DN3207_c2_g1_i2.p1 TRINITY_DN3207_c2_g1~~TRINITY_DN3207_c2_g1_i2.p1  ORF type:complete len:486 (+),score=74.47 TRINITY_DN3207_c2_g1_i2:118-1575(+)
MNAEDQQHVRRRTRSEPARGRQIHTSEGRRRKNSFLLVKEDRCARSSRLAGQKDDPTISDPIPSSTPVKEREKPIQIPEFDLRSNPVNWMKWWATEPALQHASEYFASKRWSLSDFVLPKWLDEEGAIVMGEGGDGIVWFAVEGVKHIPCVLKELYSEGEREVLIHATLDHPGIARFYGDFYDERRGTRFIILEACLGGCLFDALPDYSGLAEEQAAWIVSDILPALRYLHSVGVVYADLKTTNILLDVNGNLKIADFGASHWSASKSHKKLRNITGTIDMQPPEMMAVHGESLGFDKRVDNWTVGILIYRLIVGEYPFNSDEINSSGDESEEENAIRTNILSLSYSIPPEVSSEARELISGLLQKEAQNRLDLATVSRHPWLLRKGGSKPSILVTRAAEELEVYSLSLDLAHLKRPSTPDPPSFWGPFCGAEVSRANFILIVILSYIFGCATIILTYNVRVFDPLVVHIRKNGNDVYLPEAWRE